MHGMNEVEYVCGEDVRVKPIILYSNQQIYMKIKLFLNYPCRRCRSMKGDICPPLGLMSSVLSHLQVREGISLGKINYLNEKFLFPDITLTSRYPK